MSNLKRLGRIVKSWSGKLRRDNYYEADDVFSIINELGMKMSPEALEYMLSTDVIKEEFLEGIYVAEEGIGRIIIKDRKEIDPEYQPNVYEDSNTIVFTITYKGKEKIFHEVKVPDGVLPEKEKLEIEEEKEPQGDGKTIDIEIE